MKKTMPEASPELLTQLVDQRADFASTCCPANSPPLYCAAQVGQHLPLPHITQKAVTCPGIIKLHFLCPACR